jgi:HEAT repeat protein
VAPLLELLRAPSEASLRVACFALSELCELHAERYGVATAIESALYAGRSDGLVRRIGQQLQGAGKAEKVAMCRVLGAMHGSAAAEWLLPLLDGEAEVARAAGDALASRGRDSDDTIALALREHNSERRAILLSGVTRLDQAEAVVLCLDDPAPNVRALAAQTLARIGYVAAASALFVRLADDSPHVAHAASAAIQALGSSDTERYALEAAQSPLREVRRSALRILAYFGYESSLPLFEAALREHADDARMRDAAVQGLTLLEQPEARALLLRTTESSDAKLRAAATRALGHVTASAESLARLHAGLSDADAWVRYYACQALGRLGESAAASTDAVVTLLSDPAGQVRVAAIEALSHLPSESAILALRRSARADDPDVRRAALLGLGLAGDQTSLPTLLDAAEEGDAPTRLIALSALANFHDPRVTAALAAAARDSDEAVRTAAVGFLQASTEPDASATLIALVRDGVEPKRALEALASYPASDRAHLDRSAALLLGLEQADDAVAPLLASSLSKLGGPRAEAALLSALVSQSRPARLAAANALAALGTRDAYTALAKAASDDVDDEVRRVCALHLAG